MFTISWSTNELEYSVPLTLVASDDLTPITLEIVSPADSVGEVWLISATWPDGTTIPLDLFEPNGN